MSHLLVLCTGNYYRSRFAEMLFNQLASQRQLKWIADSRGIATDFGVNNIGPISPFTIQGLRARGIEVPVDVRYPLHLQEQDLLWADLIVALDKEEHHDLLAKRFPGWENKVEYWHVHDLHLAAADDALPNLEREVRALIERLILDEASQNQ